MMKTTEGVEMNKRRFSLIVSLLLCLGLMATALANEKNRRKTIHLAEDVLINDTLVRKGTYEVRFDARAGEVSFLKDGDVVMKTKATVELRETKAPYNSASFTTTEKGRALTSLTFQGDRRVVMPGEGNSKSAAGEQP
jgi:hypothetical protein